MGFDSMDVLDGQITLNDMDSMLTNFGDDPVPWAHFLYDAYFGDHRRYVLPAIVGGKVRYNNVVLRDIIMQADLDEDDSVNESELNATLWKVEFISHVADDVLNVQNSLRDDVAASLRIFGVTDDRLAEHVAKRNSSRSLDSYNFTVGNTSGSGIDSQKFASLSVAIGGKQERLTIDFNETLETLLNGTLDLLDMFLRLQGESDEEFHFRFANGEIHKRAMPALRRLLPMDIHGRIQQKPYEKLYPGSLTSQSPVNFNANEWMANSEL